MSRKSLAVSVLLDVSAAMGLKARDDDGSCLDRARVVANAFTSNMVSN